MMINYISILFLLLNYTHCYNVVIDTQPKGISKYAASFRDFFESQLNGSEIATLEKKRCLGRITLTKIILDDVEVEETVAENINGDYHIKIRHLHARLHGFYKHNVLFVHQTGDFELRVRDLNATIGPLIPVAIAGLPFVDNSIGCSISHVEDKVEVHGGILRAIAKNRLRETIGSDLEGILCEHLTDILDKAIRQSIANLQLRTKINDDAYMMFHLPRQPLLLPSGAIRTYHSATTQKHSNHSFTASEFVSSSHDVIYHIHERMFTDAVRTVCQNGDINIKFEHGTLVCDNISMSFKELEETQNALLLIDYRLNEKLIVKRLTVSILYGDRLTLSLRIKSELVSSGGDETGGKEFVSSLSDQLRSSFHLHLPLSRGFRLDRTRAQLSFDRIVLLADVVPIK